MIEFESVKKEYNKLKEQSEKAEKFKKISSDLKNLEEKFAVLDIIRCEDDIKKLQKKMDIDQEKVNNIRIKSEKLEQVRKEAQQKIDEINTKINEKIVEKAGIEKSEEARSAIVATAEDLIKQLEENLSDYDFLSSHIEKFDMGNIVSQIKVEIDKQYVIYQENEMFTKAIEKISNNNIEIGGQGTINIINNT